MPEMDEILKESRYYFTLSNYNVTTSRKPSYEYDGDLTGKFNYYNQRGEGMKGLLFGPKDTEVYLDVLNEKHESISTKMHAEKSKKDEGKVENVCALSHFPHKLMTNESGLCEFTCRIHHETCEKCSCMVFLLRLSWRTGPNEFDSIMSTPFSVSVKEAKESDKKLSEKKAAVVSSQESELDSQSLSQGPSQLSPPRVAIESTCFTSYYTFKTLGCLDSVTRYSDNSEHNVTQFILPSKENIWELCTFFKLRKDVSFETDVPSKYYSGYNRAVAQERKNSAKSVAPLSVNGHSSSRSGPLSGVPVKNEVKKEQMTTFNTASVYTTTAATNNNAGTSDSRVIAEFKSQVYNLLVNFTGEVLQSWHLGDITVKECEDLLRQMPNICQHATIQVQNNYVEQISKSNCFTPVSMGNSSAKTVVNKHRESEQKFYDSSGTPRTTQMFEKSAPSLVTQSSGSNLGTGNPARTPRTYSVTEDNELRHINGTPSRSLQCTPQTTERKKRTATDPPEPDSYYVQNACMVRERDNSSVQSDTSNSRRKLSNESSTPSRNFITREDSQRSVASMTSQDLQASPYTPVMNKLTAGMVRANLNSVGRSGSASYNPNSLSGNSLNAMYNNGTNSHNNSGYSVYGMSHSNNSVQLQQNNQQNNQQNSQQNNQLQFIPNSINNSVYNNNIINNPFSNNNTPHQKSSSSNTLSTLTIQIPDLQLPLTALGVDQETQTETETPMEKVRTSNAATQTRAHRAQLNPIDLVVDTHFNSTSPIIISHPMRGTGTSPFDSNSSSPQLSPLGSNGANGGTIGANKLSAFGAATNFSAGSPGVSGSVVRKNPTLQPIKHSDSPSNTSHNSGGSSNNSAKSSTKISSSTKIGSGSRMAPLPLTQQEYAVEASEALPLQHQRRSTSYSTSSSNNVDSKAPHGNNNSSGSSSAAPMLRSSTVCLTGPAQQLVSPQKKASSTAMSKKLRDAQQFAATTEDRSELRDSSHFFGVVSGSCETVEAGNNNISRNSSHQYHSGDDSCQNSNHNSSSFINHNVFERMEGVGDSGEWLGLSKAIGNSLASEDDYGDHRGSGALGVTSTDHIPSNLFSSGDFLDGIEGAAAREEQEARGFAQNVIPFPLLEVDASLHMSMTEDQQLEGEQRDQQRRQFYGHHDGAYELFTMDELSQDLTHSTINQKV